MWSGPRNISTAMMRAWGSRPDTFVTDEPFYPNYLRQTGIDHPGREEVIDSDGRSWEEVAAWLIGPVPEGYTIWYQKHMTHHILDGMLDDWLDSIDHAFLIRDPALVIRSFAKVVEEPTLADIGLERQLLIFEEVARRSGKLPPVLDCDDILRNPRRILRLLCEALEVPWSGRMLAWEPGPRATDGVWARYWYSNVEESTGFQPWTLRDTTLSGPLLELEREARPYYEKLAVHRLRD